MPRRARIARREIAPDPKFRSQLVQKFVNKIMAGGKKGTAEDIFYGSLARIQKQANRDPLTVFEHAVRNATPVLEVKPRRVGGATYQVPVEIKGDRRLSLAIRWLLKSARTRAGKSMSEKLSAELMDAYNNVGATIKKREDTHKMAEANKAFSHYRW